MTSLETLKRQAKALRRGYASGETDAIQRVQAVFAGARGLTHSDALHVIAREAGHASWPKLKFAVEAAQLGFDARAQRLRAALHFGQHWVVEALLAETPGLARADFGIACALYDIEHVRSVLARSPEVATRSISGRRPLVHLCFSQFLHAGGSERDMLAVAEALVAAGASPNESYNYDDDPSMPLSCLYGALGHARNLTLARWLLEQGADPNDGESLYHATELGHSEGLEMLLAHGARPEGTNVLPRALDFDDAAMVQLLLDAGVDPNEGIALHASGEPPFVIPALHQAVRRGCSDDILQRLLAAGAATDTRYEGVTPYAIARVYGNGLAARRLEAAGADLSLTEDEALLADIAEGRPPARALTAAKLPEEFQTLLHKRIAVPEGLDHAKRLVAAGLEADRPDAMGLTPVMIAGWEGLPEAVAYMLTQTPDLDHVNSYGGTLVGTILHGSENCPARQMRDHLGCMRLALEAGATLQRQEIRFAGRADMAAFLEDWAEAHPGQVVESGPG